MGYVIAEAIVATDGPTLKYGVRLTRPVLERVAEALANGELKPGWHHDPRIPADFEILDSGLRETAEGQLQVWAKVRVERSQWDEFQAGLPEGDLGGMSISFTTGITHLDSPATAAAASFRVAADAHHWSDEEIIAASEPLAALGNVDVRRQYQFSFDPTAVVSLGLVFTQVILPTLTGVLGSVIYDAMKRFMRPSGEKTVFQFDVDQPDRTVKGYLKTSDPEILKRAIDSFDRLVTQEVELVVWDEESDDWTLPEG